MTLFSIEGLHLVDSADKNKGEDDGVRTWSTAVQILLPVAALAILWGRRGFFAKFFVQFDKNCVSALCPSFSKRQRLLKWASGRLPPTWSAQTNTLPGGPIEFWRDGSILCTLINTAIPGACPNPHRHWRRPPSHGQALAYKYLGVVPVFAETDLSQAVLSSRNERLLLSYLLQIQQAITNISQSDLKFSSRYVVRGMGLVVGEQNRKASFYIYSSSTTSASKHDVVVSIRGPYNSCCVITVPAYCTLKKYFDEKRRLEFRSKAQKSFFRSLSIDFGSIINANQKLDAENNIPIKLSVEKERVKVVYIPKNFGMHEISIITNGFHLVGSPFSANIVENTSNTVDTFSDTKRVHRRSFIKRVRRKVISKMIDFIDEKINYENLRSANLNTKDVPKIEITEPKEIERNISMEQAAIKELFSDLSLDKESATKNNFDLLQNCDSTDSSDDSSINGKQTTNTTNLHPDINKFVTSPICQSHIEKEVNVPYAEPSEVPKENFKKISVDGESKMHSQHLFTKRYKTKVEDNCGQKGHFKDESSKIQNSESVKNALNLIERIKYWENLISLEEKLNQNRRFSVPDVFSASTIMLSSSPLPLSDDYYDIDSAKTKHKISEAMYEYKEQQKYWKELCVQNASAPELNNSVNNLKSSHETKVRRSLPNLYSNNLVKEKLKNEAPSDLLEFRNLSKFKNNFKNRKEFWENLSSHDSDLDSKKFYANVESNNFHRSGSKESRFDSDYYSSSSDVARSSPFEEIASIPKHKVQYQQTREYWENLSSSTLSFSASSFTNFVKDKVSTTDSDSPVKLWRERISSVYEFKLKEPELDYKISFDDLKSVFNNGNVSESNIKVKTNLTDDLKHLNEQREKMDLYFNKAKRYFTEMEENL